MSLDLRDSPERSSLRPNFPGRDYSKRQVAFGDDQKIAGLDQPAILQPWLGVSSWSRTNGYSRSAFEARQGGWGSWRRRSTAPQHAAASGETTTSSSSRRL